VAGNDPVARHLDDDGLDQAELANRFAQGSHLLSGDFPRVVARWFEERGIEHFDFHVQIAFLLGS
jgi:hypothetical protein